MQRFLPLQCQGCNSQAEYLQEQKQQKLALNTITASHIQNQCSQLLPLQKTETIKTASRKKSLKNPRKNLAKTAVSAINPPVPSLQYTRAEARLMKSPSSKIVFTYRPSSLVPDLKGQKISLSQVEPALMFQNRSNLQQPKRESIINGPTRYNISKQNSIKALDSVNLQLSNLVEQSLKIKKKANQSPQNQNQQLEIHYKRDKKVHFTQVQSREPFFHDKQNYSAFGSIVNTNRCVLQGQQGSSQFSEAQMAQNDREIDQFPEMIEQEKAQLRRANNKKFSFFKQPEKKFFGVRTVNTIKSMDSSSEASYLDLKYLQDDQKGLLNRLL